jgi:TPR repeat protein
MYFEGLGVPQDWVLALMWTNLAAAQGHEAAIEVRDVLGERLRHEQIAEAQRLAREWKPKGK